MVMFNAKSWSYGAILFASISLVVLGACSSPKLEKCRIIEIEPREFELHIGDTDIEGWELEVLCGDKLWDIPWKEIKRSFNIDIKNYYDKNPQKAEQLLQQLSQRLTFLKQDDKRGNLLYGSLDGGRELIGIKANRDD